MRTREEIEHDARNMRLRDDCVRDDCSSSSNYSSEQLLEVLLDIRDLLIAADKSETELPDITQNS